MGYLGRMWRQYIPALLSLYCMNSMAQCGPCAWGDTCTVSPPFPTVCPAIPPTAFVGVPYSVDVTFWVPPSFPEPTTQLNVVLEEVSLETIENIPVGLTYEASSADLTYHPQVNPFGCVRVCGVPLIAGPDTIRIHVSASGTVGGISTSQPYVLSLPISVQAAPMDSLSGYGFAPDTSCAPALVVFSSDIGMAQGVDAQYDWTFGNGNSFSGVQPPVQSYPIGGIYGTSLSRTYSAAVITSMTLTGVSGAWCGDLDEPNLPIVGCIGQPDLYFTVTDNRLGQERSTLISNAQSGTWSNPGIVLGFPPFMLRVYDSDALSDDDLLGTFEFDGSPGVHAFGSGGTSGSILVEYQALLSLLTMDSVVVLPSPEIEFALDDSNSILCVADGSFAAYEWSLDGVALPGETEACVIAQNGLWSVSVADSLGCSSSASFLVSGVGVSDIQRASGDFSVRPLPGNLLRIECSRPMAPAEIMVFDAEGRLAHSASVLLSGNGPVHARMPELSMGLYTVRVTSGEERVIRTIVVTR